MESGSQNRTDEFENHRGRLMSIAYRMLGGIMDAEDIVQEAYLRWRKVESETIQSPHSYLNTIVVRLCINQLKSARNRREEYIGTWLPEPFVASSAQGELEMAESLSMAFLVLLENLAPVERAVYLLREVFDYDYNEVAEFTGKTRENCRQIHHRGRERIKNRRPRFQVGAEQSAELLGRFAEAAGRGDMDGLLAVLSRDIELLADGGGKVTAALRVLRGAQDVARFVLGSMRKLLPSDLSSRPVFVNGRPGFMNHHEGRVHSVITADVSEGRITRIYIVSNPDKLRGLTPETRPGES